MITQIRFHVTQGDKVITTEWVDEVVTHGSGEKTAVVLATTLRGQYGPEASIMIERRGGSREPNRVKLTRYQIKVGESLYYSRLFQEHEKDKGLAEIREMFPQGEITETGAR